MPKLANDAPLQEIFNHVVAHLYKQGRPASLNGSCRYKTPEGLHCAVGCLLDTEELNYVIEDTPVEEVASRFTDIGVNQAFWARPEVLELLEFLQQTHDFASCERDGSFNMENLGLSLGSIAVALKLDFKEPEHANHST